MIAKYGADATRLSLLIQNTPGTDLKLSEDRVRGYKHFANKLWNITRFVLTSSADFDFNADTPLSSPDEALWSEFSDVIASVTDHFERHRIDLASDQLYHYAWHRFADEILEESKPVMSGTDAALKGSRQLLLLRILRDLLKLLHPFMPFVTETIWQQLPKQLKDASILMVATWPQSP
jgi:valyl-tRNA synthetase